MRDAATSKTRRIKFVLGIAIPVLVLVATIVMVSMSFAWFSSQADIEIQSINLMTHTAFVLTFESGLNKDNIPYMGQKAIDSNHHIVSPHTNSAESYTIDAPYYFVCGINISTEGQIANINLALNHVTIETRQDGSEPVLRDSYDNGSDTGHHPTADIPYVFTWFFKPHPKDAADTPTTNYVVEDGKQKMAYVFPKPGEIWYTPYGKMEFVQRGDKDADVFVSKLNDADPPTYDKLEKQDIKGFVAKGEMYDFYIVFAPEELFFSQFFENGWTKKTPKDKWKIIYGPDYDENDPSKNDPRMYYSNESYMNSVFSFGATLQVISIGGSAPAQP